MANSLEWFPFYVQRFLASRKVRRLDTHGIGIYVLLLCEQWDAGPIPDVDEEIAFVGRADADAVRGVLDLCFTLTDDGWINEALEDVRGEQERKANMRSRAGKAGAKARWGKGENGNRMATASDSQCDRIALEEIREEEKPDTSAKADGESADVENLAWGDFAGWFRATGCKRLWGGVRPPSWSHNWSMGRDLSICKAIHEKEGVPLEDIRSIIERTDGPATMQRYHGSQNRATRNALLGQVYKSQEPFGNLDIKVL